VTNWPAFSDPSRRPGPVPPDIEDLLRRIERRREGVRPAPVVLARLAARTRVRSTVASSALAGIELCDGARVTVVMRATTPRSYRDRVESEFAGYRDALDHLAGEDREPFGVRLVLHAHHLLLRNTGDPSAGSPAGDDERRRVSELVDGYERALAAPDSQPLLAVSALARGLLLTRPFERGNGRVARLMTTSELLRHGHRVARYVSLEHLIRASRSGYDAALGDAGDDPAPWTRYLLGIVDDAYVRHAGEVSVEAELIGATKREQVRGHVLKQAAPRFTRAQIVEALPDISAATIRDALAELAAEGRILVDRGRGAIWERAG
jgi:Fic family protein